MGIAGQSDNECVLMFSGSLNSSVAQRTQFFGMMRCVGASRRQIIRFVRLEALNWCKTAVPFGLIWGTVISRMFRYTDMPMCCRSCSIYLF